MRLTDGASGPPIAANLSGQEQRGTQLSCSSHPEEPPMTIATNAESTNVLALANMPPL